MCTLLDVEWKESRPAKLETAICYRVGRARPAVLEPQVSEGWCTCGGSLKLKLTEHVNHYLVMTAARTFAPNKKQGVALSDWSDCETKRLGMNHDAKLAISRATEDNEGMAEHSQPGGYRHILTSRVQICKQNQSLQGKIDCQTNKQNEVFHIGIGLGFRPGIGSGGNFAPRELDKISIFHGSSTDSSHYSRPTCSSLRSCLRVRQFEEQAHEASLAEVRETSSDMLCLNYCRPVKPIATLTVTGDAGRRKGGGGEEDAARSGEENGRSGRYNRGHTSGGYTSGGYKGRGGEY
ncbi:hypothetical protein THAOC_25293, partial [Thalassiosira oceanica]